MYLLTVGIEVGVAHAGQGGYHAPSDKKVSSIVVDFITPETETSHWYFWGMARNFQPDNAELTDQIREGQGKIFTEDLEMLEQQQQNILNNPHRKLLMLNIDAGGVQSRKVIDRLLAEENKTPPETSHRSFQTFGLFKGAWTWTLLFKKFTSSPRLFVRLNWLQQMVRSCRVLKQVHILMCI